jgi:hypothetical protein
MAEKVSSSPLSLPALCSRFFSMFASIRAISLSNVFFRHIWLTHLFQACAERGARQIQSRTSNPSRMPVLFGKVRAALLRNSRACVTIVLHTTHLSALIQIPIWLGHIQLKHTETHNHFCCLVVNPSPSNRPRLSPHLWDSWNFCSTSSQSSRNRYGSSRYTFSTRQSFVHIKHTKHSYGGCRDISCMW